MAASWSSVTTKPEFQSLSIPEKEAARAEYFDTVVAPQVPEAELGAAMSEFYSDTLPTITEPEAFPVKTDVPVIAGPKEIPKESTFAADIPAFEQRPAFVTPEPKYVSPFKPEEPSWGEAIMGHAEAGALRIPAQIGGVRRALSERAIKDMMVKPDVEKAVAGEVKLTPEEISALPKEFGALLPSPEILEKALSEKRAKEVEAFKAEVPEIKAGTEMYQKYMDLADKARPKDIDPDSAKRYVGEATEALIGNVLPTIVVGIATRNPNIALPFMGTQVYGEKYAEQRNKGRTEEQANVDALFYAASETIPESIPLGIALSAGGNVLGKVLKTAGAEGLQEMFTEVLQIGYDTGVLDEKTDLKTAVRRVVDAGIVGTLVGTSMAGTTAGADVITERLRKTPVTESIAPPAAEDIAVDRKAISPDLIAEGENILERPETKPDISERVSSLLASIPRTQEQRMAGIALDARDAELARQKEIDIAKPAPAMDQLIEREAEQRAIEEAKGTLEAEPNAMQGAFAEAFAKSQWKPEANNIAVKPSVEPKIERRKDETRRARIAEMSPEQLRAELLTSEVSGIPNRRAYEEAETLPVQASIDADSLKWFNDNMSPRSGDQMLKLIGQSLAKESAEAYHISGDEFMLQGQDADTVVAQLEKAQNRLKEATIVVERPDGSRIEKQGVEFTYGLGETKDAADFSLKEEKISRERKGIRAARGEQPRQGVVRIPAERVEDRGREAARLKPVIEKMRERKASTIKDVAKEAATHPDSPQPEPSEAQIKAGNYKKAHIPIHGLDISIENPKDSTRSGVDEGGQKWSVKMSQNYGYIKKTEGADGDHVDVFMSDKAEDPALPVFVVDQVNPKTGEFDEHKVMMGFPDEEIARKAYLKNYDQGWEGLGAIKEFSIDEFKDWLETGDTTKPVEYSQATVTKEKPKEKPKSKTVAEKMREKRGITFPETKFKGTDAESAQKVYNDIKKGLISAGRSTEEAEANAALHKAYAQSQAKKLGVQPHQVYERYQLAFAEKAEAIEGGRAFDQAKKEGYKGDNISEAEEWIRAKEKGLDMSKEARMKRAENMGFDTDRVLYHESPEKELKSINEEGRFGAIFAIEGERAGYHKFLHKLIIKGDVADSDNVGDIFDSLTDKEIRKILPGKNIDIDAARDAIVNEAYDEHNLSQLDTFAAIDIADLMEEVQKARGKIARLGGFNAVYSEDEFGNSIMVLPGNGVRSINAAFDPDFKESGRLLAQEGKALYQEDIAKLPDSRIDIYRYIRGTDVKTKEGLMNILASVTDQHDDLYSPTDTNRPNVVTDEALSKIPNPIAIYASKPDARIATVWSNNGDVYRIITNKILPLKKEIEPGSDLSENDGMTLNILSRVFHDIRQKDPAVQEAERIRSLERAEISRRQNRLRSIPEVSPDFDMAVQEIADWAENFEEFKAALTPDMFDISDRNLTRVGRATMALERDEYEDAGRGEVTIYRAMPAGEEIEAGDWVSFNEDYARGHESNVPGGKGVTESLNVDGTEVLWYGADENEWVYIPEDTWSVDSIEELWEELTDNKKPAGYPTIEGKTLYQETEAIETIDELEARLKKKYPIKTIMLSERDSGDISITMIEIVKDRRREGLGSAVIREITDYADRENKRIVLTPGLRDDLHGTTSRSRLVKFYKRFGFVENKGRNKDFTVSEGMYREPRTLLQDKRGKIQFPADITTDASVISIFENADTSTALHEAGHFFLETTADIASYEDAPMQIKRDMKTLLNWFGVKSWGDVKTKHHEQFARGFEAYLREGKSPNKELQSIFDRFKEWLTEIYKTAKGLKVKLTPEVRAVMDRMLAGESAVDVLIPEVEEMITSKDFTAENARLREEDSTTWKKAKKFWTRNFLPGGLLPKDIFAAKIHRDNELQVVEFDIEHLVGSLEHIVKKDYGKDFDNLTGAEKAVLQTALSGRVDPTIPENTRTAIMAMRQYIDTLSSDYIDVLNKQIKELESVDSPEAREKAELIKIISGNIGEYVNRSYKAFDDPTWFKKVPEGVVNSARAYLQEQYRNQGIEEAKANRMAEATLHEILKTGTAYDSLDSFINESKLGAKDLSVLKKKKAIAPQIRALLGQQTDPRLNFAKSATKMSRLIWNTNFLEQVRNIGDGVLWFEGKDRPAGATVKFAGEESDVYSPLNGMWTFPEIEQAFTDSIGKEKMDDWYRFIIRMNGFIKFGKTVLSPTTAARNWQSAMLFAMANGHFDLSEARKSVAGVKEYFTHRGKGARLEYLRRLKKLGVVYDTPYAGEMMRLLEDSRIEELLKNKSSKVFTKFGDAVGVAQKFYQYGDDFWKIIGFENEKRSLIKAGMTEAEAEVEAAERIRNTYPTYSMVGRGVTWLARFPLAGTFVSFPAEIIRTTGNMMKYVAKDWNEGRKGLAAKRMVGMTMVSGFAYAIQEMTKSMVGMDDDEEEAVRLIGAPWQRNSNLWFAGRDEKGQLRYIDASFIDPYNYWKRPITAIIRDQPWEESASDVLKEMITPFLGTDISAGAIFEILANQKESGAKIYSETADPIDKTVAIANHLRKTMQPGIISNLDRTWKAVKGETSPSGKKYTLEDEGMAWAGWRFSTLDPKTSLYYRSFEFSDAKKDATGVLYRTIRDFNDLPKGDVEKAYKSARKQQKEAYRKMSLVVGAAMRSGLSKQEAFKILKASGISIIDIRSLTTGKTPKLSVSIDRIMSTISKAKALRNEDVKKRIIERYRIANKLSKEEE